MIFNQTGICRLIENDYKQVSKTKVIYGKISRIQICLFLSILFTIFILGLSIFAYFSGKINPVENMFAAYVALSKPILVVVNTILFTYWLIRLRYWLWIPLTGLMVNYEYITSMYQIYNPTKYANENRLKIVTYNVHSFGNEITGFSAKEFAEMMNKEETDVLCFRNIEVMATLRNRIYRIRMLKHSLTRLSPKD